MRPDQELGRKIRNGARALFRISSGGAHPALQQPVAHDIREREIVVALRREGGKLALHVEEAVEECALQRFLVQSSAFVLGHDSARRIGRHVHGRSPRRWGKCSRARFVRGRASLTASAVRAPQNVGKSGEFSQPCRLNEPGHTRLQAIVAHRQRA
jgi:hypothetical protein